MPDLMGSRTAQIEREAGHSCGAKYSIEHRYPIGGLCSSHHAGVTEDPPTQIAYPDIKIAIPIPGVISAIGRILDIVIDRKGLYIGVFSDDCVYP